VNRQPDVAAIDGQRRRTWRGIMTALAVAAAGGLAAAYVTAGPAGIVIGGTVIAMLAILAARAAVPRAEGRPRIVWRDRSPAPEASRSDFPGYRKICADLGWSELSRRHYDHGVRPLLARLVAARLAERYGVDAAVRPEQAKALIGEDLWPLADPSAPPSQDSDAPGVSLATVARVISRLEEL
jgi:hypothetical protein